MKIDPVLNARTVQGLTKSFKNAGKGVFYCVKNERNMRIHLVAAVYVLIFSVFYHFSAVQYILLLLTIGMVLFAEAVNTAIEVIVNLETQCYDQLARVAKDVAAGAVLICAVFAVIVGVLLFLKPDTIVFIVHYLIANPVLGVLFLISLPAAGAFIFGLPRAAFIKIKFKKQ